MLGGIIGPGTGTAGTELGTFSAAAAAVVSGSDSVLATVAAGNTSTDDDMLAAASRSNCRRLASAMDSAHHTPTYLTTQYHTPALLYNNSAIITW